MNNTIAGLSVIAAGCLPLVCVSFCQEPTTQKPNVATTNVQVVANPIPPPINETMETAEAIRDYYPIASHFERADFTVFGSESKKGNRPSCIDEPNWKYTKCISDVIENLKPVVADFKLFQHSYVTACAQSVQEHAGYYINQRYQFLQDELSFAKKNPKVVSAREQGHYSRIYQEKELEKYGRLPDDLLFGWEPDFQHFVMTKCLDGVFLVKNAYSVVQKDPTVSMIAGGLGLPEAAIYRRLQIFDRLGNKIN